MKTKLLIVFLPLFIISSQSFAALGGGSSSVTNESSPNKSFSQNAVGAGVSAGIRFNIAEEIFSDSEEKVIPTKDHIFTEAEIFANQFFSGEIKQNFGGRINLGYEIYGFRIFGSGGYVTSTMDYQEQGNAIQAVRASAPFFGAGIGFDVTKNLGIRLNSMFYNFDFKPKNSEFKNVEVGVSSFTLGASLHF